MSTDVICILIPLRRLVEKHMEDIIEEEMGSYFAGDKSLDEVVMIIQNRVQLYIEEINRGARINWARNWYSELDKTQLQ